MLGRGETSAGRVDVEGASRKEDLADGVGEAVDLVNVEDNTVWW